MEIDLNEWQFFPDDDRRVHRAALAALRQIRSEMTVAGTRIAKLRGSGVADATCVEIWCATVAGVADEIHICLSARDAAPHGEMIDKFAAAFAAQAIPRTP